MDEPLQSRDLRAATPVQLRTPFALVVVTDHTVRRLREAAARQAERSPACLALSRHLGDALDGSSEPQLSKPETHALARLAREARLPRIADLLRNRNG